MKSPMFPTLFACALLLVCNSSLLAQNRARIDLNSAPAVKVVNSDTGATFASASDKSLICEQEVTANDWTKFSVTVTPQADGKLDILLRGHYLKSGGEMWVDFDQMEVTGATLANGDFEQAGDTPKAPAGWECKKWSQSKVVRSGAKSGSAYVQVSHANRIWQTIDVKKDQRVTITVFARLDAKSAGAAKENASNKETPRPFESAAEPAAVVAVAAATTAAVEGSAENPVFEAVLAKLPAPVAAANTEPSAWRLKNGKPDVGVMSIVDVQGMPFKQAVRMDSRKRPDRDYMFQAVTPTTIDLKVGDTLLLTFYARAEKVNNDTSVGQVNMRCFSMKSLGQAGSAAAAVTGEWQKFYFPWTVFSKKVDHFDPGELMLTLNQGLPPQIVDIADIRLVKYPAGVSVEQLPHMVVSYEGREADAPWRKAAEERIDKIRKADLSIHVTDASGKPVPDAQVQIRMKRHAFGFGSAYADPRIDPNDSLSKTADSQRYREEFLKLFNVSVSESGLKWEQWLEDREQAMTAAKWMLAHNIPVRGHTLVWPQLDRLPYAKDDPKKQNYYRIHLDELQKLQTVHIRDEMTAMKGLCFEWDLINEAMSHFDYQNLMGMDCFLEYFKIAHEIDPDTHLIVNENKLLNSDGGVGHISFSREEDFYKFLKYLKDHGAPLSGIGIQSHWGGLITPPQRMLEQLDRFAEFGSITITEFSEATKDEQLQADVMRDFLTMCFSHPAINTFIMWGFWDGQHYARNAPIFRKDWSLKPSGQVYMDLVFHKWWTNLDGTTNADGDFRGRGFMGDYQITVQSPGHTAQTLTTKLAKDTGVITIKLD